ncbi:DUF4402 domain-containing protein [Flavobacterium bomense]|uniref:DUF4402 domain-containing protein n=1 Tax=Flavobacterium bomense TaxID=2497483 RepID=A0A3S0P257_9FLAO|nr:MULTISPECIES: DUF4402 domain-containing protein [Flavobacterium]RTY75191.1 DUF4402 domain-containing protein [Flavobacterium sp. LS1R10]RTY92197.1 DUF4402 domain-containing protein [Flavobacterium sp. RSP46]RTZ06963.1 DUF4402 domain-containing protein [Flavobacterium bomense]
MKKITSLLSIMALTAVFSTSALAQQSASASAPTSTTIVAPIGITKTTSMTFGSFATGGAGTLVMTSAAVRSATGGVKLTTITGSPTAAEFSVTGQASYGYDITLPASLTLTTTATGTVNTMIVNTFTSSLTNSKGTLGTDGTNSFTVGATLNVLASQVVGTYTNADGFAVTVNYN